MAMYGGNSTKYDIPLSHLDFDYITKCSDVKELEKILKILRSKEEGCYPDLELHCEQKLASFSPAHRLLRKDKPLATAADLGKDEWKNINNDLDSWSDEMTALDAALKANLSQTSATAESLEGVPVRKTQQYGQMMNGDCKETKKNKPVLPRSYNEWDRLNIDEELAKIDDKGEGDNAADTSRQNSVPEIGLLDSSGMTSEEKVTRANREKDKGNEAFRSGDLEESVLYYTRSITLNPTIHAYNNRALSYLKLSKWTLALRDCKHILKQDPNNIKALMRSGSAYKGKKDWKRAADDFILVLTLEPSNKKAMELLEEVQKEQSSQPAPPSKVKGHRMVIEEIEGDESEVVTPSTNEEPAVPSHVSDLANETRESPGEANNEDNANVTSGVSGLLKNGHITNDSNNDDKDIFLDAKMSQNDCDINTMDPKIEEMNRKNDSFNRTETESESDIIGGKSIETENDINERREKSMKIKEKVSEAVKNNLIEATSVNSDITTIETGPDTDTNSDKPSVNSTVVTSELCRPVFYKYPLSAPVLKVKTEGGVLFGSGQYGDACVKYTTAIEKLKKEEKYDAVNLSLLYTNRATCNYKIGDMSSAISDCTTALEILPHSLKALLRRALAYEQVEKYGDAHKDFKHVLMLDSTIELAFQGSTRIFSHMKELYPMNWETKIKQPPKFQRHEIPEIIDQSASVETSTKSANEQRNVRVNNRLGTKEKVEKKEKVLSIEEKFEQSKLEGNNHVKKGEYELAVACYTTCVESLPGRVVSYTNRALCYLKLNKNTEAVSDCSKALAIEGDNVKALFRRALARKNLTNYKESLTDLTKLLKLDPVNALAKKEMDETKALWRKQLDEMKKNTSKKSQSRRVDIEEVDVLGDTSKTAANTGKSNAKPTTEPPTKAPKTPMTNPNPTPPITVTAPVLPKVTPYEFMKAWNSLKNAKGTQLHAKLIRQVPPELIPKVLSNKLDGDILTKIIKCLSDHIMPQGDLDLSYSILYNLTRVQRFSTVSAFLSQHEKYVVEEILGKLSSNQSSFYTDQNMDKLKILFSL